MITNKFDEAPYQQEEYEPEKEIYQHMGEIERIYRIYMKWKTHDIFVVEPVGQAEIDIIFRRST